MACWNRDNTLDFIELYRGFECIWKFKSKEYHNKQKREAAYVELLTFVQRIEPKATKETVLKKINNLHTVFRKELKKFKASQKSGSGTDNIYVPKLWYYNQISFLSDQEEAFDGTSNLELEEDDQEANEDDPELSSFMVSEEQPSTSGLKSSSDRECAQGLPVIQPPSGSQPPSNLGVASSTATKTRPASIVVGSTRMQTFKRAKTLTPGEKIMVTVGERLAEAKKEDQIDTFGKNVAQKLRILGNEQRIFAQKVINDALFEAELGTLTRFASINPGHNPYSPSSAVPSDHSSFVSLHDQVLGSNYGNYGHPSNEGKGSVYHHLNKATSLLLLGVN